MEHLSIGPTPGCIRLLQVSGPRETAPDLVDYTSPAGCRPATLRSTISAIRRIESKFSGRRSSSVTETPKVLSRNSTSSSTPRESTIPDSRRLSSRATRRCRANGNRSRTKARILASIPSAPLMPPPSCVTISPGYKPVARLGHEPVQGPARLRADDKRITLHLKKPRPPQDRGQGTCLERPGADGERPGPAKRPYGRGQELTSKAGKLLPG